MKATAIAPATIAFIKFWGKKDERLRLPENTSIAMTLDRCLTSTTVEFSPQYQQDTLTMFGHEPSEEEQQRVFRHLSLIRELAGIKLRACVMSRNTFPPSAGIAASASGFAALTLAATDALGLKLSEKKLPIIARLGSGSACRSIPGGIVEWKEGKSGDTSYAYSIAPPDHWRLVDVLAVVSRKKKKVGSTKGHAIAGTSVFHKARLEAVKKLITPLRQAIKKRDIQKLGEIIEKDCLFMHSVMMTSSPALLYWVGTTVDLFYAVYELRRHNVPAYFTVDAGPNVHVITEEPHQEQVAKTIVSMAGVEDVIVNRPCRGAYIQPSNHS